MCLHQKCLKTYMFLMGWLCFIDVLSKTLPFIMVPITKPFCKIEVFTWIAKCQEAQEAIKQRYLDAPILITPKWDVKFHIHTNVSNLAIKVILAQNPTWKCEQPITYAFRVLNNAEKNYTTTKKETLAMVYVLEKFKHYLLGNKFFFTR